MKKYLIVLMFGIFLIISACSKNDESSNNALTKTQLPNSLSFSKLQDLGNNNFEDQMIGFVANPIINSLFISCKDKFTLNNETVYSFDLNNQKLITKKTVLSDFVTKRNHIYNNKLYVFGATGFTIYNLDLTQNQPLKSYGFNMSFSRFGSALLNDNLYIIGGFLGGGNMSDINFDKKIWRYNISTNLLTLQSIMSNNRNGGSSEIVNNKIYTFFGYENIIDLNNNAPTIKLLNNVQIYDINTNVFQTISLSNNVKVSFTAKYNNYIIVAGNKTEGNFSSPVNGSFFGYFDTITNTMTEVPITVNNNAYNFSYISEIEVLNNKIYAVVKDSNNNFSIQMANLQ